MFKKTALVASLALVLPFSAAAEQVVGKIQSAVHMSKTIQYLNPKTKEVNVIKYDENTVLVDAESFKDLTVNTKFKAEVDENGYASKIKRVLVKLPADQVIDTDTLSDMLDDGEPVFIGDARPVSKYNIGHIPTSKPTPSDKLKQNLDWLPEDKDQLLVFYCGGVTCPLSPAALKIAQAAGYTNVKAYVEGFPAWKGDVYPAHVNADWLKKNLNKHHVILDVRDDADSFVKGAVHMPASKLADMHEQWNEEKYPTAKRTIFELRDKKAPIIIVADGDDSDEAIEAFETLTFWKFKNVTILKDGLEGWKAAKLPTGEGKIATKLVYEKKLAKGAVEELAFVKAAKEGAATIIDVRNPDEMSQGKVKGSINIPLDQLEQHLAQIPKDKPVILHCVGGARAALGYTMLSKKGYKNVKYLNDTFVDVANDNGIALVK
ncbi:rhodanese-like domain-containing protein [Vibrio sp. JC009]|uniref:rhodanese-like domain-containing protein n=1 Tax=Vibrio sp. JC009 TaxID=2912314 RepID=UPI0023AE87D9|nr:rhodanese-like domain-containing protein [Vibrio sp. JC009]WED20674.1 rhodanese-like domain-containing protein [Vibrio sp. JC009]